MYSNKMESMTSMSTDSIQNVKAQIIYCFSPFLLLPANDVLLIFCSSTIPLKFNLPLKQSQGLLLMCVYLHVYLWTILKILRKYFEAFKPFFFFFSFFSITWVYNFIETTYWGSPRCLYSLYATALGNGITVLNEMWRFLKITTVGRYILYFQQSLNWDLKWEIRSSSRPVPVVTWLRHNFW